MKNTNLDKIISYLFKKEWNWVITTEIIQKFNISEKELMNIIRTKSLNKWYISYKMPFIKLTDDWIKYYEEKNRKLYLKIMYHLQKFNWFYAVIISIIALIVSIIALYK